MADEYSPVFANSEVLLSDRDCWNCLWAYYEQGDPQAMACPMYDDEKPLKVQCAEEHCPYRVWDFATADRETLEWVLEYAEKATRQFCGYKDQIKGLDRIRRLLQG